ncbi:MAG: non-heme iron oxygenase ferredoxin subunit [Planctomycetes bacterium]|nr:non-heme iron oxygenase ferredoxin subunit [Planctomycetota bacterium]
MAFTTVARVGEISVGGAKQVTVAGKTLALFNVNGNFHAIDNECPHRNAPLAEGTLQGTELECPWHGARFDVCTGAVLSPPARSGVKAYKVQVSGDEVQVEV